MISSRLNEVVLALAPRFQAVDVAPGTVVELFGPGSVGTLVVWSGASAGTIFGDPAVNHAFRAWHDSLHLLTRIGFGVVEEIELGRRSAEVVARIGGDQLADLVYLEIAGQAAHYGRTGEFVANQVEWTLAQLKGAA